ncbi:nuclear hormone receptor FTZ-F1 [Phymastichus coffea]|uniref:nuclear hormone receptor FTZ-F1 n=1 Tax=Phymastichus coffea TaxID=108790 RepID=UPI00273B424E|nr:nuclear hormone receptor FTZ-F1 [Phymastichus coffea]
MLLEMEQHSGLISLNMSPFQLSPQNSPQAAGSQTQQQSQQQQQQQQQQQSHAYSPSPYANCAPSPASNMCHPQQSMSQGSQAAQQQAQVSGFEAAFYEMEDRCPMCGDKMSGYQYGLLSCESCKGFYRRNNSPSCSTKKVYTCLFSPTGGGGNGAGSAPSNNNNNSSSNNNNSSAGHAGQAQSQLDGSGYPGNSAPSPALGAGAGGGQQAAAGGAASNGPGALCHPGGAPGAGLGAQVNVGVVTGSIPGPSDFPDTKDVIEELCPVCGDKVSGYHYGLLTCESCKGFFKRTVQNKKVYTCVAERSCHIDKTQRKRCPFCRFQKCLEVGMKLEAVRADRMRGGRNKFGPMYKRDRARKLQMMRQRQLALQTIRGTLGDPTSYPNTVAPFLHIKQEIQIPQVSSLTSSPDSSPSPAAVAAGLVTTQAGGVSGSGQQHMIAPSTQASLSSATSNSGGHMQGAAGSNPLDNKLWPANSTTPSPKGFGAFEHHGPGVGSAPHLGHLHQAGLSAHHGASAQAGLGAPSAPNQQQANSANLASIKTSPMIRDFIQSVDDREWQASLFGLLQNQTYNQCEVDLFELMCKVLDQNLFSQVDWARNSVFFKDLKVDDQMKLLQHSWSDMLVLDHLHQRLHNNLPDETTLHNGQKFDLLCLGLLGVPSLADLFNSLSQKLQDLKFDLSDYICMKFLMLLNHDVRGLVNKKHVQEGHEQVQQALLDYTLTCYPSIPDKFNKLLAVLPDIHVVASRGEDHLYQKHCSGGAPTQTLLMEMLHAKRK